MRRVKIPTFLFSLFLSSTLVVITALPAFGYIPRPVTRVFISTPPKVVRCDQNLKIEATLRDVKTGRPVAGQPVIFRLVERQHPGDKFLVTKRRSQKDGYVASVFHFGNKAGQRRISVSIPNSKPVANIRCAGGLAKASIMPPEDFVETVPTGSALEPASLYADQLQRRQGP